MRRRFQLPLQTADLIAGFMVWVILSSLLPYIKQDVYIPPDQIALVTAIPVVLGSVLRVPFGYCANLFGARAVFLASFIVLVVPVWFLSEATTYQGLLIGGTFLGIAGAVFSVGVTSLPKYYPKERHGFVNGVYGFGNMGTALTTWLAPVAAVAFGWRMAVKLYLVLLAAFIVLNFVLGDRDEPRVKTPVMEQLRAVWSDARLWFLSLFYFVTFGAFVALTVYLPNFLTSHYGMDGVSEAWPPRCLSWRRPPSACWAAGWATGSTVIGCWPSCSQASPQAPRCWPRHRGCPCTWRASIWSASHAASATAWCSSWCLRTSRSKPGLPTASWP